MAVSVDYVVRETASNLWRNRLMTVAAILTVAVSLSLVGAALLLRQGSANATGTLERGTQVTVWMQPNADTQEIAAVGTELGPAPRSAGRGSHSDLKRRTPATASAGSPRVPCACGSGS